jgi:hypothetical protein
VGAAFVSLLSAMTQNGFVARWFNAEDWARLEEAVDLAALDAPSMTDNIRARLTELLTESKQLRQKRNNILHASLWLEAEHEGGPMAALKAARRQRDLTRSTWSLADMHQVAARLYQLSTDVNGLELWLTGDIFGVDLVGDIPLSHQKSMLVNPHDPSTWPPTDG